MKRRAALGALAALALPLTSSPPRLRAQSPPFVATRLDGLTDAPYPPVDGAPQLLVQSPATLGATADVVLHLHGYEGCLEVLAGRGPTRCRPRGPLREGWDLLAAHASSGTATWLVLPQLAFDLRDGSPGRLARSGSARRLLDEALARVAGERGTPAPRLGSVILTAHSAGFEAAIAVIRHGGLDAQLEAVVLFDAMYSGVGTFAAWALASPRRSLVAFHTVSGTPARRARELEAHYGRRLGDRLVSRDADLDDVAPGRVVLAPARCAHRDVPGRYLGPTVARLAQGSR
ncbi:MAG: hypothetical protein K1X94_25170 [Sandaracinaceae bacterium]|nr:hypothetical protein [Sandaracinaceae bacterium]